MSTRSTGYGLSADIAKKIAGKYDEGKTQQVYNWFTQLGITGVPTSFSHDDFGDFLRNGEVLCQLGNILEPGAIKYNKDTHKKAAGFRKMKEQENISIFLKWSKAYGMKPNDAFSTPDLFENQNLAQVQSSIFTLGSVAMGKFNGPTLGIKISEKNTREFTEEQLRSGDAHIPLQSGGGTNKLANQSGMSYGAIRQINNPTVEKLGYTPTAHIPLQSGTNAGASQAGMSFGKTRDIYDKNSEGYKNTGAVSGWMGTNEGATQKDMIAPGTRRPVNPEELNKTPQ